MNSEDFLQSIRKATLENLALRKRERSPEILRQEISRSRKPMPFLPALLQGSGPRIIAEVKRASPSLGKIAIEMDPVDIARGYGLAGAAAISVLTESTKFGGSIGDLAKIRAILPDMPLLMKDFVLDHYQLLEARSGGADAVLLIHAFLGPEKLRELHLAALNLGLTPLVEVHTEAELRDAFSLSASLVGINNRDLNDLRVDVSTSVRLSAVSKPANVTLISESGIEGPEQIRELSALGFQAFLIGTKLMAGKQPETALRKLLADCR